MFLPLELEYEGLNVMMSTVVLCMQFVDEL